MHYKIIDIYQKGFVIFGGSGFIGKPLGQELARLAPSLIVSRDPFPKIHPYGFVQIDPTAQEIVAFNPVFASLYPNYNVWTANIMLPEKFMVLASVLYSLNPIIIDTAGVTDVRTSTVKDLVQDIVKTAMLCQLMSPPQRLVFISSTEVYGYSADPNNVFSEDDDLSGLPINKEQLTAISELIKYQVKQSILTQTLMDINPIVSKFETYNFPARWYYAIAKRISETLVLEQLNSIVLRLSNVFGAGAEYLQPNKVLSVFIGKAFLPEPKFVLQGDGGSTRTFIHLHDVIEAIKLASLSNVKGIFNITNRDNYISILTLAELVRDNFNMQVQIACQGSHDNDYFQFDTTKAEEELGFQSQKSLKEHIENKAVDY